MTKAMDVLNGRERTYSKYDRVPFRHNRDNCTTFSPGKGETLRYSHKRQETLKKGKCTDKFKCMDLPKDIIDILKQDESFKKAGFEFDPVSGKLIFPEGFNNTEKIRKVRKFLEFSGWMYSAKAERLKKSNPTKYKIEKFNKYIELTKLSTQIEGMNKKLLQYRYINSIYQDIIDEGFIFQKDKHGNYTLINPKTGKEANGPYARRLLDSKNLNSFDFDFAFISSITNNSAIFNEKGIISQKHTMAAILDKHKIVDQSGNRITPVSIMLVDWDNILTQVNDRISHVEKTNLHSYQELMYLKGFIENKDYLSKNKNKHLYQELNTYNKTEGQVNSLLGSINGETSERTIMEKLAGIADELAIPGILLGILLSIFSGTRSIGKALLIGGIGGLVGSKVIDVVGQRIEGFSEEDLGLIIPQEIVYSVETKNKDYDKGIKKLQKLNKENLGKSGYTSKGEKLPSIKDNKTILAISKDILKSDKDFDVIVGANSLYTHLKTISPSLTYKETDVKSYLKLLNSEGFSHDSEDKTIRDYLSEGLDIANRPYKSLTVFEGIITGGDLAPFDTEINNILKPIYDSTKTDRNKRKEFIKILNTIKSEFSGLKILDSFASKKANIKAALEKFDPSYKNILDLIFTEYETYQKSKNILEEYTGLIDGNTNDVRLALKKVIGTGSYNEIYLKIENAIKDLNSALIINPTLKGKEPFKTLNKNIKNTIKELEKTKIEIRKTAEKNGLPIIYDPIDITKYNTSPEILYEEMKKVFNNIESVKNNIKSGTNIKSEIKNILDNYKWLKKGVNILNGQPTNTGTGLEPLFKQKIQNEIVSKFSTLEDELKKAIVDKLLPIYKKNKDFSDIVNGLTTDINITNIENLLKVQNYINTYKSEAEKAEEGYKKAKELFSSLEIKDPTGDYSSSNIGALISNFEAKKLALETAVNDYLLHFIPDTTVPKIKEQAKILKVIKDNFPSKKTEVEVKEQGLFNKYITIETVGDFSLLNTAKDMDIGVLKGTIPRITDAIIKNKLIGVKQLLEGYDNNKTVEEFLRDYNGALTDDEQKKYTNNIFRIFEKGLIL